MSSAQFTLNNSVSNGTSNLSYLLDAEHQEAMNTLTPALLEDKFGLGIEDCGDRSKGYTDPEWYWQASNGSVWGIGWRWGSPRLRGRGGKQSNQGGPFWIHPKEEEAAEFIEFLRSSLSES